MSLEEFMKSQQRIIDKIPKMYGITPLWLEKISE
ncbi:MAG: hypothetical protein QG594_2419, partial [Bacteroidota bacterium]|nr:hypothetical protein [Bacteroidota bacterium]